MVLSRVFSTTLPDMDLTLGCPDDCDLSSELPNLVCSGCVNGMSTLRIP
jgi:hypothetical protein